MQAIYKKVPAEIDIKAAPNKSLIYAITIPSKTPIGFIKACNLSQLID